MSFTHTDSRCSFDWIKVRNYLPLPGDLSPTAFVYAWVMSKLLFLSCRKWTYPQYKKYTVTNKYMGLQTLPRSLFLDLQVSEYGWVCKLVPLRALCLQTLLSPTTGPSSCKKTTEWMPLFSNDCGFANDITMVWILVPVIEIANWIFSLFKVILCGFVDWNRYFGIIGEVFVYYFMSISLFGYAFSLFINLIGTSSPILKPEQSK